MTLELVFSNNKFALWIDYVLSRVLSLPKHVFEIGLDKDSLIELSTSTRLLYTPVPRPLGRIPRFSPSLWPIPRSAALWPHMFWRGPRERPGPRMEHGSVWCRQSPLLTRLRRWSHTSPRWSPPDLPTAASHPKRRSHRTRLPHNAPARRSGRRSATLLVSEG